MAIINNNVQNVQFLRNQNPLTTREAAISALQSAKADALDGSALLARYKAEGDSEVTTMVGYVFVSGATKDITIFDLKGSEAAVQALREEINAKLGEGITSGNTATAQLQALSGNSATDTSATTSVEGAKKYADALKSQMDYADTAVPGNYVSKVDQVDGIITVTREALPSVTDAAVAKNFVTQVTETNGEIAVTRGSITSSGETIVLTDNADGGVNFEVHYDGTTIIQDPSTKELKVASSALIQYVGDEDTIHISEVAGDSKTVSSLLTIQKVTTGLSSNVKEEYHLVGHSGTTIGAPIQIYKDSSLYNVYLGHVDDSIAGDPPVVTPGSGDTALCFIYHKEDGSYELAPVNVEAFLEESEFASGVTADSATHIVHGVVDPTSEKDSNNDSFLTVGADGFKVDGIKDEIDAKIGALDATVGDTTVASGKHVAVQVVEEDGVITAVTVTEDDIASADDIEELSAKTVTNIKSTNSSIDISTASTADGTVDVDVITDASKIQMSGFTSNNGVLSGITPASSVTEAFEEVDKIITENEEITSAALNDLDARIKTVSGEVETLTGSSLSGITVNDAPVTVANGVAALDIESATSAMTATSTEAIVVDTDENGNITLGLAAIDCGFYE